MLSWVIGKSTRQPLDTSKHAEALALGDQLGVRQWVVARPSVTLGKKLGNGAFGTVYACTIEGEDSTEAVAKQINPRKLSSGDVPLLKSELQIWSTVTHPNCVRFLGACLAPTEYLLLAECMRGGTLEDKLVRLLRERAPPPTQEQLLDMMTPIAQGMEYLHSKGIIHRDLKSANILIEGERLAISDFGLSRPYASNKQEFTAETGSYRWMAPEVTRHEPYDEKCDVYSYACLAYEMLSYRKPFDSMTVLEAAFAVARDGLRPEVPSSCPEPIAKLVRQCWAQRSEERPAFTEVLKRLDQFRMPCPDRKPQSCQSATAPSTPSHSANAPDTARNSELKRKTDNEEPEDRSERPEEGGLKRPKSISSALVDLNVF